MHVSLRKSCYYSGVSIPAEPAPVCTFPSLWASKDSHLACNKMLLYFPCKPNTLTSLGVCLVYGLRICSFISAQLSRPLFPALPQTQVKAASPSGLFFKFIFVSVMCSLIYLISMRYQGASHFVLFKHSFLCKITQF